MNLPQPRSTTPEPDRLTLSQQIFRLRWLLPITIVLLVLAYQSVAWLVVAPARGWLFLSDAAVFGLVGPGVVWFALGWIQREVARKEAAEAQLTRLNERVSFLVNANRRLSAASVEAAGALSPLTLREAEILRLVAAGCTNRETAARLSVSENTIKTHLARIFEKLGATSRTEAVALARARSWLPPA